MDVDKLAMSHYLRAEMIMKQASSPRVAETALYALAGDICDELGLEKTAGAMGKIVHMLTRPIGNVGMRVPGVGQLADAARTATGNKAARSAATNFRAGRTMGPAAKRPVARSSGVDQAARNALAGMYNVR